MNYQEGSPCSVSISRLLSSANSTNGTFAAAGRRRAHRVMGVNVGGSIVYLKLYDKATAPIPGTDVPFITIALPAGMAFDITLDVGVALGLGFALTGASADNDTTAISAGAIIGFNLLYSL